jgi:zinc protease
MIAVLAAVLGCGGAVATSGPTKVDIPVADGAQSAKNGGSGPSRQSAPASGVKKESPFPRVARFTLRNGLNVAVVTSRVLPVVQARLLVRAGSGDGATPALAGLTGDMLKDGGTRALSSGDLLRRIETLGADLSVVTTLDSTVLAMPLTKDQLGEGLSLLSQVVREPRFDEGELRKRKARATDEAQDEARSNGRWTAMHLVFRELFPEKSAYATYGTLPSHVAKVDGAAVREFHRRFYVPKAATLVLAGDLDEAEGKALAELHFGTWAGGERPKVERAAPRPLGPKLRVLVAHRPKSVQSDIYVATLGPARKSETWTAVRVANQVLGGGMASRLFADVRERRGLAYTTNVHTFELASGEQPVLAYAGTESGKTPAAVAALLENLARMTSAPPTSSETEIARSYVSDVFAIRMETIGSIADMVVTLDEFGLPDGYWDAYRRQLRATESSQVEDAAKKLYPQDKALVVVAGDADVIAPELAKLGDVTVVDPEKEFKTMRTIPQATK